MRFKSLKTVMLLAILTSGVCVINYDLAIAAQSAQDSKKPSFFKRMWNRAKGRPTNNEFAFLKTKKEELLAAVENVIAGADNWIMGISMGKEAGAGINNYITHINNAIGKLSPQDKQKAKALGYCVLPPLELSQVDRALEQSQLKSLKIKLTTSCD